MTSMVPLALPGRQYHLLVDWNFMSRSRISILYSATVITTIKQSPSHSATIRTGTTNGSLPATTKSILPHESANARALPVKSSPKREADS